MGEAVLESARRAGPGAPVLGAAAPRRVTVSGAVVDGLLELRVSPGDPVLFAELARIPGRRFVRGANVFPPATASHIQAVLERHGLAFPPGLAPPVGEATYDCAVMVVGDRLLVELSGGANAGAYETLGRCVPDLVIDPATRWGRAPWGPSQAAGLGRFLSVTGALLRGSLAGAFYTVDAEALALAARSRGSDATIDVPGFVGDLRPFQRATVAYCVERRRAIIGDDPGLGKTRSSLAVLSSLDAFPAIVVCQGSMKLAWEEEVQACLPGRSTAVVAGTTSGQIPAADVVIVNREIIAARLGDLQERSWRGIVLDEVQNFKGADADRTKAVAELCRDLRANDAVVLELSATLATGRASHVIRPLELIDRLATFGGREGFVRRYCRPAGAGEDEVDRLVELHERLRATCYVRHAKADVLSELPPVQTECVPLGDLDPVVLAAYAAAERDVVAFVAQRARETGLDVDQVVASAEGAEGLVRMAALRQLVGMAKVPGVVRWSREFLDATTEKLLVFAWHRSVVTALAERLGAPMLVGGMPPRQVEAVKQRFQEDPACPVLVLSLGVGGTGHTLTAASNIALAEEFFTPDEETQAIGRAYGRLVDVHGVTAWHLFAPRTIDDHVRALRSAKVARTEAINDGRKVGDGETALRREVLLRLVEGARLTSSSGPAAPDRATTA